MPPNSFFNSKWCLGVGQSAHGSSCCPLGLSPERPGESTWTQMRPPLSSPLIQWWGGETPLRPAAGALPTSPQHAPLCSEGEYCSYDPEDPAAGACLAMHWTMQKYWQGDAHSNILQPVTDGEWVLPPASSPKR